MQVESDVAGAVWRLKVAAGDAVEAGATLAVLECMKMEIPVLATRAGRVAQILVEEGQMIEEGEPLFTLDPS